MYCLWPLPCILLVYTTLLCVLFVATPMSTISVYYKGVRQFYHNPYHSTKINIVKKLRTISTKLGVFLDEDCCLLFLLFGFDVFVIVVLVVGSCCSCCRLLFLLLFVVLVWVLLCQCCCLLVRCCCCCCCRVVIVVVLLLLYHCHCC